MGITGLVDNFKSVMTYVAMFSVQAAVMRFYVDYKDNADELPRYIGTLFSFSFLSTLFWCLLIAVMNPVLMPLIFQGINFMPTMVVALVGLIVGNVSTVFQQLLRGMEDARRSALVSVGYVLLAAVLTIVLIVPFGMGANGVLIASAASGLVLCIYAVVFLKNRGLIVFCMDWSILKDVLRYSIPLLPHNLSTNIATLVSSVLINGGGSLSAVGVYNLASKFGTVCDTLQSSVSNAYQPWLFKLLHDRPGDFKEQIRSFTEVLLWIYALIFVALGLFIQDLILLFLSNSYGEAWMLVPLIIGVYSIKTIYYFYIGILFYYKEAARFIFVATLSSSILNVALSVPLISLFGAYGSVLADAFSMILRVGLVVLMSRKYDDCGYRIGQFVRVTLTILIVMAVGLVFSYTVCRDAITPWNMGWKLIVYAAFFLFVCVTHRNGVKTVAKAVRSRISRGFR